LAFHDDKIGIGKKRSKREAKRVVSNPCGGKSVGADRKFLRNSEKNPASDEHRTILFIGWRATRKCLLIWNLNAIEWQ
jgi:hypothetical protein